MVSGALSLKFVDTSCNLIGHYEGLVLGLGLVHYTIGQTIIGLHEVLTKKLIRTSVTRQLVVGIRTNLDKDACYIPWFPWRLQRMVFHQIQVEGQCRCACVVGFHLHTSRDTLSSSTSCSSHRQLSKKKLKLRRTRFMKEQE